MFSEIPISMQQRMEYLEKIDEQDRIDGSDRMKRLRQIPRETGKFISLTASNCPEGEFVEIGTSAGFSTMWLSLAAKERHVKIKTHELLEEKIRLAKESFKQACIEDWVELIEGDAIENIKKLENISFCFLDCEKEMYEPCWEILSKKMVKNGILIADNAISHADTLLPWIQKVLDNPDFDSLVVPIGKGELVCRKK